MIDLNGLVHVWSKVKTLTNGCVKASDLATVATSGSYNDLTDKPTIPASSTVDSELSSSSTNPVQNKVINAALNSKADSSVLSAYLPLAGGVCTGSVSAPKFQTGTGANNYFQCRKFRGEGDANTYYHAVDFGYSGHDSVDFYEYDPNWNFYKCTTGTKSGAVLVGNINGNGWNGGARLTGAPTAPTATAGTNTTQIATTAFVQTAVSSKVSVSELATVATSGSYNDLTNKPTIPSAYTLPYATSSILGGVKIGNNISVSNGTISLSQTNIISALGYTPSASDTTYGNATTTSSGLMSSTDKVKLNGIADNANYYIHPSTHPASMISGLANVAKTGSYNDLTNKPTIPSAYTLPYATSSILGGVKIGNNISVSNGTISLSQTNIISALGYTPSASDTTYGNATTTSSGLMSSTDKVKLNGIADNANYYIHPSTHPASMISGLANVAKTGSYNDLTNKPTIPAAVIVDDTLDANSTNAVQNKVVYGMGQKFFNQISALAVVARTGSYSDLTGTPGNATASAAGLMSAADKSKLDGISSDAGSVKMIVYS